MKEKSIFSSVKVVILTLVGVKLIGFIKQAVIAAYFGTSADVDKFLLVSELMENLGIAVFSAIAITFLTLYVEANVAGGKESSNKLTSNVFLFFLPFVLLIVIALFLFSDQIASLVAPGYRGADHFIISKYIKMFAVTVINMFIFYICNAVLEAEKVFFPGKVVGVIRSICVIASIVFLSGRFGIYAMYIGVITYFLLESSFVLFYVGKRIKLRFYKPFKDPRIIKLLKLSGPLFISYGVLQIQSIVDKAIGSGLPDGSIAALSYSGYLYNTTHSILIGGLCTVLFSFFTTYVAEKKYDLVLETLYKYLKISIIILVFISFIFIGYAKDIISIVYERGVFGQDSVNNVSLAFCAYSIGLVFIGIRDIMIRTHYAYQSNTAAMVNGIAGVAVNILMSLLLSRVFGFAGIALGTSIASICIAVLSCQTIKKSIPKFRVMDIGAFLVKILIAAAGTSAGIYLMNHFFTMGNIFISLFVKCILSLALYLLLLKVLKCREINEIKAMLADKMKSR